jgi:hypothetical protein
MFKVGDKVFLKPDHLYASGMNNPTNISGTIIDIHMKPLPIRIKWSNGEYYNNYRPTDLIKASKLHRYLFEVENGTV